MRRSHIVYLYLLTALAVSGCTSNETAKRKYLASGNRYFDQQKFREAIVEYRNAVQKDPRFGDARLKLAEAYERNNDLTNAYREYVRAADLLPNSSDAQIKAGQFLLLGRQFEEAKSRAKIVLDRTPGNVEARILLGNALAGLKDFDAAIKAMEEAASGDPAQARPQTNIGYLEVARGRKSEAEQAFKQGIAADPKSVSARLALANFYLADDRPAEAEQMLKDILAFAPNDVRANRAAAAFYMASQRAPEAEPFLKTAADGGTPASRLELADYYAATKRDDDAKGILETLAKLPDTFSGATIRLADLDNRQGRRTEAYARLAEVLRRDPKNGTALLAKGQLLVADKKYQDAVPEIKAGLASDPRSTRGHFLLAAAYKGMNDLEAATREYQEVLKLTPGSRTAPYELARLGLATGKIDSSVQYAQQAVTANRQDPDARLLFAISLSAHREFDRAEAELQKLAQEFPNNAGVCAAMGTVLFNKQRPADARKWFERALSFDAANIEATTGLVNIDALTNRPADARKRLDARVAMTPEDAGTIYLAANAYAKLGDTAKAEELLKKTIQLDPSRMAAYFQLGRLFVVTSRLDEAKTAFQEAIKRQPNSVGASTMIGMILQVQGHTAEAEQAYQKTLEIDPEASVAANNLAWLYVTGGKNLDIALQLAQSAKRKLPNEPNVSDTLGWIYYKKEMIAQAVPAFEQSVQRAPNNPEFQFHLGLAYIKAGKWAGAKEALTQALKLNPNFEGAGEARQALSTLGA